MGSHNFLYPLNDDFPPIPEMMAVKLNCTRKVLPEELFFTRSCLYEKQENCLNSLNSPASSTPYHIAPSSSTVVDYCNARQELRTGCFVLVRVVFALVIRTPDPFCAKLVPIGAKPQVSCTSWPHIDRFDRANVECIAAAQNDKLCSQLRSFLLFLALII